MLDTKQRAALEAEYTTLGNEIAALRERQRKIGRLKDLDFETPEEFEALAVKTDTTVLIASNEMTPEEIADQEVLQAAEQSEREASDGIQ
jgi:hypothetical protein